MNNNFEIENFNNIQTGLVTVNTDNNRLTVSGRELHTALEVKTAYKDWFPRMTEYGFTEGVDFNPLKIEQVQTEGKRQVARTITDHQLTIDMAKELCMIQRTEKGKQCRKYFIEVEKQWNDPVTMAARSLIWAHKQLTEANEKVAMLTAQVEKMKPESEYYRNALECKASMSARDLAKSLGISSANKLNRILCDLGVQYKEKDKTYYHLYAKYGGKGYAYLKCIPVSAYREERQLRWTPKGKKFVYDVLVKNGVISSNIFEQGR